MRNKGNLFPYQSGKGFQPVDPWESPELGTRRRNLAHIEVPQATYLVTFRCRGGITLPGPARDIVLSAVRHWDGQRIEQLFG
jgi:hypothetical protein